MWNGFCVKLWVLCFVSDMSERMSEDMSERISEDMLERMSERMSENISESSNLAKRGRNAKDCSMLLQLLLALRIWNRPPFIRHIPLVSLYNFLHDKHENPQHV